MEQLACSSVKESMIDYLRAFTDASQVSDETCVLTLPISTFDQRWVEVSIEQRSPDYFVVDDSGRAWDELYVHGVSMTDTADSKLSSIASKFGVRFEKGRFKIGCKIDSLQHSIWAIGQCSALAMGGLIDHVPTADKELKKSVGSIVRDWGNEFGFRVKRDEVVHGTNSPHKFDFVAEDYSNGIALNVLSPTSGAYGRAERYAYQALDLAKTRYAQWKQVAVLSRPLDWSYDARDLLEKFAAKLVDFHNPQNDRESLYRALDELRIAA
jgi:hypothetical protein